MSALPSFAPGDEILRLFRVRLLAPLGGRLNKHWLVERGQERLVLRRWADSAESVDYEVRLLAQIADLGWPVPLVVEGPAECDGHLWSLSPFLPGEPPPGHGSAHEQRARGRRLVEFHESLATLGDFGPRGTWRRCEAILADPSLDHILTDHEREHDDTVRVLRWHLARARERAEGLRLAERPGIVIHGDFTPWNLRFQNGRLSGILDFELAHGDHRVADFALAWRGKYDDLIHGYAEVSPLAPEEWASITPVWWAGLIEGACRDLQNGTPDDGWTIGKLLLRSPLMGADAAAFR